MSDTTSDPHPSPAEPNQGSASKDERHHPWYDDDFCAGGGRLVGKSETPVPCPVCGELMDVDEDGYLFKHRPHIPGNPR